MEQIFKNTMLRQKPNSMNRKISSQIMKALVDDDIHNTNKFLYRLLFDCLLLKMTKKNKVNVEDDIKISN